MRVYPRYGPPAAAVSVTVTPNGGRPRLLAPSTALIQTGENEIFQLPDMPLAIADHPVDMDAATGAHEASAEHLITVEYSDLRELLRWRLVIRATEVLSVVHRLQGSTSYPERIAYRTSN